MPVPIGSRRILALAGVAVVLSAGACGAGPGPGQTVTTTATAGPASGDGPRTQTHRSSPLPVSSRPGTGPEGLHPLAGGPIPEEAYALEVVEGPDGAPRAVLQTPSGNIHCEFGGAVHGCGVLSYAEEEPYGSTDRGPRWWFDLGDGARPAIDAPDDPQPELSRDDPPPILEYGRVAYSGDDVCASEEEGLTCWNAQTGHGVFLSRRGYQTF